ncbi:hypothetical protein ALC60_00264 [Trachymyrmex zeteki]|uniref:Uncharacterized protein n=1 Tax=Mycetomoellerius zeteki TaxID=64791 RepID=A0A151XJS5_9HYME|nr:hypothetical protein ALC60_00264 [Trachymyrmex zeteki]
MSFLPRACRATTSLSAALELTVLSFVAHPSCASAQKILLQSPGSLRRESRCPTKTNGGDRAAEGTLSSTGILSSVRPLEESDQTATINLAKSKVNTADNQYENERYVCSDHLASLRFFPRPPAPSRGLSPLTRCPFRDETTVPTEPPPKTCSPSATGNGGGGGGGGGGKRGRAVLRPPEKLEAVKVASSLGLQGPSAPIGAQLLATGGSEDAPTATVYHANLVAGSNTSVVTAALQQPILASLNSAALASMQASAEANSRNITTMEWLYKKEPLFTLAHFWQQVSA